MNRIKQREQAFVLLFQSQFKSNDDDDESLALYNENVEQIGDYAIELFKGVKDNTEEIDGIISDFIQGWKISRISKVNLSILRIAVYEMKYVDSVPDSVAINEAVELCKKYSGKEDSSFVNGILGSYSRSGH